MNPKNLLADLKYTSKQGLKGSFKDKRALLRQHHALTIHPFDSQAKDTLKARKMQQSSDPNVRAQGKALQQGVDKTTLALGKRGAIAGALAGVGSYLNGVSSAAGTGGAGTGATTGAGTSVLDQSGAQLLGTSGGTGALVNTAGQGALTSAGNAAVSAAPAVTSQAPSLMSKIAGGAKDLVANNWKSVAEIAALKGMGDKKNKLSGQEQALINQQTQASAQAGAVGTGLLNQYQSGTLAPADMAQINQYKQQAIASLDQYLANAGLSDSSAGVQMKANIEQNATIIYGKFRDQTLQEGLQALGVGTGGGGAAQLLQTLMQRDTTASTAWANAAQTYMHINALSA